MELNTNSLAAGVPENENGLSLTLNDATVL
jgi:hypothetical protein